MNIHRIIRSTLTVYLLDSIDLFGVSHLLELSLLFLLGYVKQSILDGILLVRDNERRRIFLFVALNVKNNCIARLKRCVLRLLIPLARSLLTFDLGARISSTL